MIHRVTFFEQCCIGTFPLRMGNRFLSGYFRLVVGPVSDLVAHWWQHRSKSCPVYHQPQSAVYKWFIDLTYSLGWHSKMYVILKGYTCPTIFDKLNKHVQLSILNTLYIYTMSYNRHHKVLKLGTLQMNPDYNLGFLKWDNLVKSRNAIWLQSGWDWGMERVCRTT